MPFIETGGKLSYPLEIRQRLFSALYDAFKPWHGKVYFYLCMEDASLWKPVFGYEYRNNEEFEKEMKANYIRKIRLV